MTELTLNDLQTIMTIMNAWTIPGEQKTDILRKKLEYMIAERSDIPEIEHRILGGVPVIIEHIRG
jgi:hypothetical protein